MAQPREEETAREEVARGARTPESAGGLRVLPEPREQAEHVLGEKDRIERRSQIRQFVFGSLDGLLVPLGVVSGVAGGTGNTRAVIVAGLAEAFAGALSMGFGEFLSGRAEAQVHQAEVQQELQKLRTDPDMEFQELVILLESEGVRQEDAHVIARRLQRNPASYAKTMVEKELGLDVETQTAHIGEAFVMGFSYMAASVVPLISYFFLPIKEAFVASLAMTLLFLVGIGFVRGKLAQVNLLLSALEVVAVGVASALGGFLLGTWLPKLLGY